MEGLYRLEGRCTRLVVRRLDSRAMRLWRRFLRRGIWEKVLSCGWRRWVQGVDELVRGVFALNGISDEYLDVWLF